MADAQIVAGGTGAVPLAYTVPGSQEIILKSLYAEFNGAAAAVAWLPCIRIVAPGGKVVGEYVTQSSVAAGGSADVSFGPFLRGAAAAATPAATSLPFAMASDIDTTITTGVTTTMNLNDWFGTTDSSVFSTRAVAGKTHLNVKTQGMYRFWACTVCQDAVVTGPLTMTLSLDSPSATVDTTELNVGQQVVSPVTSGGAQRWLLTFITYLGIPSPAGAAFSVKVNAGATTGNINNQHTDVALIREGDFVSNVLF